MRITLFKYLNASQTLVNRLASQQRVKEPAEREKLPLWKRERRRVEKKKRSLLHRQKKVESITREAVGEIGRGRRGGRRGGQSSYKTTCPTSNLLGLQRKKNPAKSAWREVAPGPNHEMVRSGRIFEKDGFSGEGATGEKRLGTRRGVRVLNKFK